MLKYIFNFHFHSSPEITVFHICLLAVLHKNYTSLRHTAYSEMLISYFKYFRVPVGSLSLNIHNWTSAIRSAGWHRVVGVSATVGLVRDTKEVSIILGRVNNFTSQINWYIHGSGWSYIGCSISTYYFEFFWCFGKQSLMAKQKWKVGKFRPRIFYWKDQIIKE